MATAGTIVDDRDPGIQYEGAWNDGGTPIEYQGTTKYAIEAGATASFTFVGSLITVYGSVSVHHPAIASMSFSVDSLSNESYIPPDDIDATLTHSILWSSPVMNEGSHKLMINQTKSNGQGQIYLDYFIFNQTAPATSDPAFSSKSAPPSAPATLSSTGSPDSGSSGAAAPSGVSSSTRNLATPSTDSATSGTSTGASASSESSPLGSSMPTDGIASNPTSSSPKSTPTAAIVAAILGALLVLVVGGIAVSYLRRRHRGAPQSEAGELRRRGTRTVTPFVLFGAATPPTLPALASAKHGGPSLRGHHPQSSGIGAVRSLSALHRSNRPTEAIRVVAPSIGGTEGQDEPPEYTA